MLKLKSISQIKNLKNKKILLRTDFNVPIKNSKILEDFRIKMALPLIQYLIRKGGKIIIISHLGQPFKKSKITQSFDWVPRRMTGQNQKYSLKLVAARLGKLLNKKIVFIDDCLGEKTEKAISEMKSEEIVFLENLRLYPEEEKNNSKFAKKLGSLADVYINEAFSVCHRKHASVSAITKYLPSYAGFLLEKEIVNLAQVLKPKHPAVAILGGAKISTKIGVIKNLLKKFDKILIGGAVANNFLLEQGYKIGKSTVEKDYLIELNKKERQKVVLPVDVVIKSNGKWQIKNLNLSELNQLKDNNFKILDIGLKTIELFQEEIKKAKTIVWNGPMGLFEERPFDLATKLLTKEILRNKKAMKVIGGGETIAAFQAYTEKRRQKFCVSPRLVRVSPRLFVSTGGGAMLEFLEGKVLPGIKPLMKK